MAVQFKSYENQFAAALSSASFEGVKAGARELRKHARRKVSKRYKPGQPSKPGEPPKRRTGRGWNAIQVDVNKQAGAARLVIRGTAKYMFLYETGRGVDQRPWLLTTLEEKKAEIINAIMRNGKRNMSAKAR